MEERAGVWMKYHLGLSSLLLLTHNRLLLFFGFFFWFFSQKLADPAGDHGGCVGP